MRQYSVADETREPRDLIVGMLRGEGEPQACGAGRHRTPAAHLHRATSRRSDRAARGARARQNIGALNVSAYFVTSTGTDIGKTFVTAGLIRYLREAGQAVHALKPVVSGYDPSVVETSDPAVLLAALGRAVSADEISSIAPWRFRAPLSPDLAAARENARARWKRFH